MGYLKGDTHDQDITQFLIPVLKQMISECEVLFDTQGKGLVLKCNDSLAVKIARGNDDYTEVSISNFI